MVFLLLGCADMYRMEALQRKTSSIEGGQDFLVDKADGLEERLKELEKRLKQSDERISGLLAEIRRSEGERMELQGRILELQKVLESRGSNPVPTSVEVKVLSGDPALEPAKAAADKIRAMGYNVLIVDRAPRKFDQTVVYYTPNYRADAARIAKGISGSIKPLTWNSIFNIIAVVTNGKEHADAR